MANRHVKDTALSDINYFQKKLNKYINQKTILRKEVKELRKNATQNADAILKKLEYLDNLNNTIKELSINNLCTHKNLSAYLDYEKPR